MTTVNEEPNEDRSQNDPQSVKMEMENKMPHTKIFEPNFVHNNFLKI